MHTSRVRLSGRIVVPKLLAAIGFLLCATAVLTGCGERKAEGDRSKPYTLNTKVRFGTGGDGAAFISTGWSSPEPGHTWSDKNSATLVLDLPPSSTPLRLRMHLTGLKKAPELPFQPVELLANDAKVADWQVGDEAEYTTELPADLVRSGGPLRLEFRIPHATTPKQLGLANDERVLGVALHSLEIDRPSS
jgi:hypothetical protein